MQPYTTGPCRIWVGFPGVTLPQPLGTCERGAKIRDMPEYEPIFNDFGGTKKPFENMHQGTDSLVAGVLTRYRHTVLDLLAESPSFAGLMIGGDAFGTIGTMMGLEARYCTLYLEYMYGNPATGKAVHVAGGMPPGRRYFGAAWMPSDHTTGTGNKTASVMWHCHRVFNPVTAAMICWDNNLAAIAGLPFEITP